MEPQTYKQEEVQSLLNCIKILKEHNDMLKKNNEAYIKVINEMAGNCSEKKVISDPYMHCSKS